MSAINTFSLIGVSAFIFSVLFSSSAAPNEVDPNFKPMLLGADFTTSEVRPGDSVGLTLKFVNNGTRPARDDYTIFLHFEHPEPSCNNIKIHSDHSPSLPTSAWRPGETVIDGPYMIDIPSDLADGDYHVHVGVYAPMFEGVRLLDTRPGVLKISRSAPPAAEAHPEPISQSEIEKRHTALAERLRKPIELDSVNFSFALDRNSGAFQLVDKRTGVLWGSSPYAASFGRAGVTDGERRYTVRIEKFDKVDKIENGLKASLKLAVDGESIGLTLNVFVEKLASEPEGIRLRYDTEDSGKAGKWQVESVRILDNAFWTTDADEGYAVVPYRLGEMLPAANGFPTTRRYMTYSGSTMALYGAIKRDSALLIAWPHPDTELEVQTSWPDLPLVGGRRMHCASITLKGDAREISIHPLGAGNYVKIGRAYSQIARRNGWVKTWAEKRRDFPTSGEMLGAADFKPFVFSRSLPSSRYNSTGKEQINVGYTFDEAAQVAEHLHRDLKIDKAMYVLAGWIHRGYDNQHPDILPAAPECGGSDALADCARRVRDCGFLFGLHDNYQDMYEDAPSWDEKYLNKNADGTSKKGGNWAGGQAWQVCAIEQVNLAARPETNLPKVAELFGPTIYFIDTTFAWGLVTCEDPAHPMSRLDDMKWKSRLCDLAKEHFGLFGSEEGREWAVPHADYMEGLLSHKLRSDHPNTGDSVVIPMFEIIYGDCVNLYGHQGDRATPNRPDYILDCLVYAEMPVYSFGAHLYYKESDRGRLPITVGIADFQQTGRRTFQLTYRWEVSGDVADDYRCFVHFTHPEGERSRENIAFQDDHSLPQATSAWKAGDVIEDGPRTIEIPEKYRGEIEVWIGLSGGGGRAELTDVFNSGGRHHIGTLNVDGDKITFTPSEKTPRTHCFARGDNGWAEGLHETDRLIKNTYEVLSWVNRLTAETPMTDHRFLSDDRSVEWSQFGDVQIWVNYGRDAYKVPPIPSIASVETILPRYGFLAVSPTFVAFHADSFGGLDYEKPALFTARSLDGKPLRESEKVRIYHGFGDTKIRLGNAEFDVNREEIVTTR